MQQSLQLSPCIFPVSCVPCSSYLWWPVLWRHGPASVSGGYFTVRCECENQQLLTQPASYYPISSPCLALSRDKLGQALVIFRHLQTAKDPLCAVDNLEVIIPSTDPDPDKTQNMSCNWAMGFLISYTSGQKQYRPTSKQTPNTKYKTKQNLFSDDTAVKLY